MSNFKSDEQHQMNLKALGRMGGIVMLYFGVVYLAAYTNIELYPMRLPWFVIVIIVGGFYIVPRARKVMRAFEDNIKTESE